MDEAFAAEEYSDETLAERGARLASEVILNPVSQEAVDHIVERMLVVVDELSGHPLRPYQVVFAHRVIESLVIGDGETITALFSRQCVDGDAVVFRRDGTAVRMREHEDAFPTGVKPTKRYKLRGGAELVATDNHPVYTPGGWVGVGMLRVGDLVAVATEIANWGDLRVLDREIEIGRHRTKRRVEVAVNEDLGKLLGYFITDGSHRPGQSAKFTNTREVYLGEFGLLMEKLFGIVPRRYAKGDGADLLVTTTKSSYANPFRDFLHALTWDHGFPLDVFSFPPQVLSAFVNRAWAGDGCISMKPCGPEISLACGNDEVYARYWQALLLKFGVRATVKREVMAKGTGVFHRLVVGTGARNIRKFIQCFGLIYGKEEQTCRALDYFADKHPLRGKGRAEREMFKAHGWGPDGERICWTRVVAIEDVGEREVFDMHVADKGWFICQGVQVSNSGKSETVANVVAACMIMFPLLAVAFPDLLDKFREGMWVGAFAPVDEQADNLYGRIVERLTSDRALEIMADPEIAEKVVGRGRELRLVRSGSLVRKTTCHPRAKIEGRTYHLILIDEAQDADEKVVNKSITPMGASTNATMVWTGTPTYVKGVFYRQIQANKRAAGSRRAARLNHFEADWKVVSKTNANYKKFVSKEMLRIGEDSDEFKLSYRLIWLLETGMFTTSEKMDELADTSMQVVQVYHQSPVLVGIDPARKQDSTVVCVVWVNWNYPDEFGQYEHRILNWLDLTGLDWEVQYFRIVEFLANYSVLSIGIDSGGIGDVVASRLRVLMPGVEVVDMPSDRGAQSKRWKHLMSLMSSGNLAWPAHAKTRRLRTYRRFRAQMEDAELRYEGPNVIIAAPKAADAHDDYVDALANAVALTADAIMPEVEQHGDIFRR